MITVKPKNKTSAFYFTTLNPEHKNESVTTSKCFRCFGGMIIMERNKGVSKKLPLLGLYTWHILPGPAIWLDETQEYLLRHIEQRTKTHTIKLFARCGGQLDTKENIVYYNEMMERIEKPFMKKYPNLTIIGDYPTKDTEYTQLTMKQKNEKFEIFNLHKKYGQLL